MVLHVGQNDAIALAQVSASPTRGNHVETRRGAPGEDHLFGPSVEESCQSNPGGLVPLG